MNTLKNLAILGPVLLLVSCLGQKEEPVKNIANFESFVVVSEKSESKDLGDAVELVGFTRLEKSDDILVGDINKIIVNDSSIFILDKNQAKRLFIFNRDGSCRDQIYQPGNGPNEWGQSIHDFDVSQETGDIVILGHNRILVFDQEYQQKKFIVCKGYRPRGVAWITSDEIALSCQSPGDALKIISIQNEEQCSFFPWEGLQRMNSGKPFFQASGKVIFDLPNSHEFWQVEKDKVFPYKKVVLPKPVNETDQIGGLGLGVNYDIRCYTETKDIIYFTYNTQTENFNKTICFIHDKRNGKQFYHYPQSENTLVPYAYAPRIISIKQDTLVSFVQPSRMLSAFEKKPFWRGLNSTLIESLIEGTAIGDNPIVIFSKPHED